jgi:hypothetical protein
LVFAVLGSLAQGNETKASFLWGHKFVSELSVKVDDKLAGKELT